MTPNPLLGGLSPDTFLRDYWQRRPLLVRQAFPGIRPLINADELAGLALEPDVPSRLVVQSADSQWDLRYGPFDADEFATLPSTHWTLLVTDLEKFVPELHKLIAPFRFLPDWRIDDLMISFAAPLGSVGPHIDAYDVFLLQLEGSRRWQIDTRPVSPDNRLLDTELHILARFEAESEWILEPGDMLYLPPGVAHYGIALDACMTASVGFRAPSQKDLAEAYLDDVVSGLVSEHRFCDRGRTAATNPGEIDAFSRRGVVSLLREAIDQSDEDIERWFGRYITEPRAELASLYPEPQQWDAEGVKSHLANGFALTRNTSARLAFFSQNGILLLYADGEEYPLEMNFRPLVDVLCQHFEYPAMLLQSLVTINPGAPALIAKLLQRGILEPAQSTD